MNQDSIGRGLSIRSRTSKMDMGLDIRLLAKCIKTIVNGKLDTDLEAYATILSLENDDLLSQINLEGLFSGIRALRDSPIAFRNVSIFLRADTHVKTVKFKRIISYIKSKISVLDFISGLMSSGHDNVADLLSRRLYRRRFGEGMSFVAKVDISSRKAMHVLVRKLKVSIDSKIIAEPLKAVRRLAIEYKHQLQNENNTVRRQKIADKYMGVLAVEIDTHGFSHDECRYASLEALLSEFKRITQLTSSPALYEALLHIRLGSHYSYCGKIDSAKEMVTQAMVATQNIGACPELTNIWYEALNVYLLEFEDCPERRIRNKIIQTGYTGIQTTSTGSDFNTIQFWTSCILIRMAFACLGIGIRGNVIHDFIVTEEDINLAQVLLAGVEEKELTMRRRMFYSVAVGRLYQLRRDWPKAAFYFHDAKALALKLGFEETKYIVGPIEQQAELRGR